MQIRGWGDHDRTGAAEGAVLGVAVAVVEGLPVGEGVVPARSPANVMCAGVF